VDFALLIGQHEPAAGNGGTSERSSKKQTFRLTHGRLDVIIQSPCKIGLVFVSRLKYFSFFS
jgi:hypothetical protein